jgi:protocatechuate 3,4-dioxygenase alpha subunit
LKCRTFNADKSTPSKQRTLIAAISCPDGAAASPNGRLARQGNRQRLPRLGRRCSDLGSGVYTFDTIKPGLVEGRNGRVMVPHMNFWIAARGINIQLNTRMYFSDEAAACERPDAEHDRMGSTAQDADRRTQRVRRTGGVPVRYGDSRGSGETVFFDI